MKHIERLEKKFMVNGDGMLQFRTKLNLKGSDGFGDTASQDKEIEGLTRCNASKDLFSSLHLWRNVLWSVHQSEQTHQ